MITSIKQRAIVSESLDLLRIESEMFKIFMDNKTHQKQISL